MNPRTIALVAVALGIAIGAGFMVSAYLSQSKKDIKNQLVAAQKVVPPTIPTARVLVAKKDLIVGTFVKRDDLHWQLWPEESITPAYVTDGKLLDAGKSDQKKLTIEDFVAGVVRQPISAGQPMIFGLVSKAGERGFLAAVLQPGMRAMSVPVGATSGVSGFILPGDHIDILWDVKKSDKGVPFTQTLFRDIRVIAIDQKTSAAGATPAKTLTLELTPFQTEAMSMAQTMGGIEYTLRSIVPEVDKENILDADLDEGLLARVGLGKSDGIERGALLGNELLVAAREKEIEEIARDSYTLGSQLLYGKGKTKRSRATTVAAPQRAVPVSTGGTKKKKKKRRAGSSNNVLPSGRKSLTINIVRGTATQSVKVKNN